ncbi:NAD(P)-dependent oxidoreductase [Wenzhouxiangella sp. AB-CW3]|uniref:NAD(P)-dependent oxidoreductase n=1 Tax=Wenzhouxiangella sp. AB-CW3 TaxID=2771012 RepID=UPI00168B0650|nr:NAD(P)-dependent oxidoreductase [Wenzhouxiangella sp. AB-CW3]QOC22516.1 NAD(P)-dependent oxidoreductase [Wenzhouxiangella sp. AB-CW3]
MNTAWIGLGAMGAPMAGHLAGDNLLSSVWNRTRRKATEFTGQFPGTRVASDPIELVQDAGIIFLCVSADDDLRALIGQVEDRLAAGQIIVDHSTVAPATAQELSGRLEEIGVAFIDAPVTGGVEGAINGQLAIMAGGDHRALDEVEPVMRRYARIIHHLGPSGSGQAAKAVNQLLVAGIAEAVCESLALMEKLQLPATPMLELLGSGAAGNWFLEKRAATMLDDSFEVGFDPRLLLKDLRICQTLCSEAGFDSGVVDQAIADYSRLIDQGSGEGDISSLIRLKREPRPGGKV